jgi:hypothetical protein
MKYLITLKQKVIWLGSSTEIDRIQKILREEITQRDQEEVTKLERRRKIKKKTRKRSAIRPDFELFASRVAGLTRSRRSPNYHSNQRSDFKVGAIKGQPRGEAVPARQSRQKAVRLITLAATLAKRLW